MNNERKIIAIVVLLLSMTLCACAGKNRQTGTIVPPPGSQAQNEPVVVPPEVSTEPTQVASPNVSPDTPSSIVQQPHETAEPESQTAVSGEVVFSFDYVGISGSASNQFAVWIEDMEGNYLQTVFATRWTANGGFETRPDSIAIWVEKSGISSMPSYYVDAVSGATPQTGEIVCIWDLTDLNGNTVPSGEYRFFVEGTLRWKNYVLYSGIIEIGSIPATVQADAEFVYEGSGNQPALTGSSPENAMIGTVTANFVPNANG